MPNIPEKPKIGIIILAGGKGTRMGDDALPKVLVPLYGQPLIAHLLHSIESVHADMPPIIVVGYKAEMVKGHLGAGYQYAVQTEQLGTGHAVMQAQSIAQGRYEHIVVLYGDMPHIPAQTINELIATHLRERATLTMMTATVQDFEHWRMSLYNYGRIIRDQKGDIARIVERKDATTDELAIKEVNPSYFCFKATWLWENLPKLGTQNTQSEYYLTDMLALAIATGEKVATFACEPLCALGVNTREELQHLEAILNNGGKATEPKNEKR